MTKTKTTAVKSNGVTITKIKEVKPKKLTAKQLQELAQLTAARLNVLTGRVQDGEKDLQACHEAHNENEFEIRVAHAAFAKKTASSVKLIMLAQIVQAIALLIVIFKVGA